MVIVLFVSILLVVGCGWGVMSLCHRACARRPHKRQCYSLLDEGEDDAMIPRGKEVAFSCVHEVSSHVTSAWYLRST